MKDTDVDGVMNDGKQCVQGLLAHGEWLDTDDA